MRFIFYLTLIVEIFSPQAFAHPVSFKGAYGVMPEYMRQRQELEINYSFASDKAFGISGINVDFNGRAAKFILPRFNYRIFRANEMDSQFNIYLSGGAGVVRYSTESSAALLGGFQADYETRRFYTLFLGETLQSANDVDISRLRYRIGVAPYLADFDALHTWLILSVDYMPDMQDTWTVTPTLRLFYRNYLLELGINNRGDPVVSGIFHF